MSFEDKQTTCSDCWITARDAERERIIKLLGDECCQSGDCRCSVSIDWLIALIKGENK